MTRAIYKGFSTANWRKTRSLQVNNIELVKIDLLNHIYTERGERVMMPGFGTRIPALAFEPNDETSRRIVEEDLTTVFNYDPRVKLMSLNVLPLVDNNAIVAVADLLYVEFDVRENLRIEVQTQ